MNNKELGEFVTFVESPFFNKGRYRKEALILLNLLVAAAPEYPQDQIQKATLYPLVFPGQDFVEGRIEKVMVDLSKMIRHFWLMEYYMGEEQDDQAQLDYVRILRLKGFTNKAEIAVNGVLNGLEMKNAKNKIDYERLFHASSLSNTLESQKNKWKGDLKIFRTLKYLDLAYYLNRTTMLNLCLQISKVSKIELDIDIEKELSFAEKLNINAEETPNLFISREIFKVFASELPRKEDFESILNLLTQYEQQIDLESLKLNFGLLRSFCSLLINDGNKQLMPVLHKINKDNLIKGYFYHLESITIGAYRNIVQVALSEHDFGWAFNFIESHKDRILDDNEARDCYLLTLATYYFHTKEFDKSLGVLPDSCQHLDSQINAKVLEIKLLYELKSELLEYKIDAFKMFVNRTSKKNLSEVNRDRYSNFINFLYQILHSKPGQIKRGDTIVSRINEKRNTMSLDWLIEKALQLK